jgi:hypothetical protein
MRKSVALSERTVQKCRDLFNRLAVPLGVLDKRAERLAVYRAHNFGGAFAVPTQQLFRDCLFSEEQRTEFRLQKLRCF